MVSFYLIFSELNDIRVILSDFWSKYYLNIISAIRSVESFDAVSIW